MRLKGVTSLGDFQTVDCKVYSEQCTIYNVIYTVQRNVYNTEAYRVKCIMYSIQCGFSVSQ